MQRQEEMVSDLSAIGFAVAGFTFWTLADCSIKLLGQSSLLADEAAACLGLFMALFITVCALGRREF
jgi:hypothetical protein